MFGERTFAVFALRDVGDHAENSVALRTHADLNIALLPIRKADARFIFARSRILLRQADDAVPIGPDIGLPNAFDGRLVGLRILPEDGEGLPRPPDVARFGIERPIADAGDLFGELEV